MTTGYTRTTLFLASARLHYSSAHKTCGVVWLLAPFPTDVLRPCHLFESRRLDS
ncbi:hypothetical protein SAMD00023353_3600780 [Rosellinia necatrix]|uniref:Uncharacterized protein n=1 Tax=Rosellinia necatrix TaxID=77044 RepID=A0A1S8A910_ROSNE|nr:hypothetical protein SAMD00023353_3600780 [Rosellinia necatrix]